MEVAGEEAKQPEGAQTEEFKVTLSHSDVILLGKNLRKCLNSPCKGSHHTESLGGHRSPVTELVGPLSCCSLHVPSNDHHTTSPLRSLNQSLIIRCSVEVTLRLRLGSSWEQGAHDSRAPNTVALDLNSVKTCCFQNTTMFGTCKIARGRRKSCYQWRQDHCPSHRMQGVDSKKVTGPCVG